MLCKYYKSKQLKRAKEDLKELAISNNEIALRVYRHCIKMRFYFFLESDF